MRADVTSKIILHSASLAVIRSVKRRRMNLLRVDHRPVICRRAIPLDFADAEPFRSSLERNIDAMSSAAPCS